MFIYLGTNTYIIGEQNPYTLIDTGEGREDYIPILESALRNTAKIHNVTEPHISDIIISHWHPDHVNGLPSVLSLLRRLWGECNHSLPFTPPRLHKFPRDVNAPPSLHGTPNNLPSIISSLSPDLYTSSPQGHPFHDLYDSQIIAPLALRVLHTPGHTDDSIALYIPKDRALYTGDSVLGQGTAVFDDLALYLKSLDSMLHFGDSEPDREYEKVYPGHGPVVPDGKKVISGYITHRLEREAQILKLLKSPPPGDADSHEHWTTWTIVTIIYATYPRSLWLPAVHSVDLHLRKLEGEGVVRRVGGEGKDTSWEILTFTPVDHQAS